MKQFGAFILKEFRHIFRDARTMMILLGMPVIQIVLFGFAITTEVKNSRVAIYDPSKDNVTRAIVDRISTSEYFEIAEYMDDPAEITTLFREGKTGLVICFSENFNENLLHAGKAQVQLIADATDPNTATTLVNYATAIISLSQRDMMTQGIPFGIVTETKFLYNPQMKGAYNFVPGVLGMILMLICAMMTSIAIVREKETGTMEVLLVSPMRPIMIIIAKVVPYFALSCVNLATVLVLSVFVLDVPIAGSLFWLVFVCMLFIFVSLALGLLVSNLTDSQMAAMLISGMAFMMPVMLLSGMMFPIESMPWPLQWFSNLIPAKWFIIAVKNLMIKGTDVTAVAREIGILCLMAVVILGVSLSKFKTRLE
jgi:ABC-2 type transport system permease protein